MSNDTKAVEVSNDKYILVEEMPNGNSTGMKLVLKVERETPTILVTREVYSINLLDLAANFARQHIVRWNRSSKRRVGETTVGAPFIISKILSADQLEKYEHLCI